MDITRGGQLDTDLTAIWLLVTAFLVFFMQARPCTAHFPGWLALHAA